MFKKVLIANRGEIAVRIINALREMNIPSAAVFSEADRNSLHVRMADEAYLLGPPAAPESYLNINRITDLAQRIGADAVHPGYGFLSENADFIARIEEAGIKFIGPSSRSVAMMGNKTKARSLMHEHNVPIVPGALQPVEDIEEGKKTALSVGYPVMLKAAAGGGGKGMRIVTKESDFDEAFSRAGNESLKAFGDSSVYIEKFIEEPRHIEVQIIADNFGNYRHLFERECSIQRRHQKIIEESPSVFVDEEMRRKITAAAVSAARACSYVNAGTIEFLADKNRNFYFLEMNTRLQVEHPVTEMITGIDLVKEQIRIAAGLPVSFSQEEVIRRGHSLECRIYAEDAENNFAPSTGRILHHRLPCGSGIRVDRGIDILSEVTVYYDPLLSKVITWGGDRAESIARMKRALGEYQIAGIITNIPLCKSIISNEAFISGNFNISFIERKFNPEEKEPLNSGDSEEYEKAAAILAALIKARENELNPTGFHCSPFNKWEEGEIQR